MMDFGCHRIEVLLNLFGRTVGQAVGLSANVVFEPRPPGDPMRTRADASRLAQDLGFVPTNEMRLRLK